MRIPAVTFRPFRTSSPHAQSIFFKRPMGLIEVGAFYNDPQSPYSNSDANNNAMHFVILPIQQVQPPR
jgi:hypothetical protein